METIVKQFESLDKSIAFRFLNSPLPISFNEVNKSIRPQISVKSFSAIKQIWPQCWKIWELDNDLLIDIWYSNTQSNESKVKLRKELNSILSIRKQKFINKVRSLSKESVINIINTAKPSLVCDKEEEWMKLAGYYIEKSHVSSLTEKDAFGLLKNKKIKNSGAIGKPEKSCKLSMLEKIREREKMKKIEILKIQQERNKKNVVKIEEKLEILYSLLYDQSPKFGEGSIGLTLGKICQLLKDSGKDLGISLLFDSPSNTGKQNILPEKEIESIILLLAQKLEDINVSKVGDVLVVRLGHLDRESDLSKLKLDVADKNHF
ncbi:hypothetical protein DAMA08_015150 [Martiniozyma asiatica (nom. inval.)]|nr:hypothetical protein DAMA08_015150 [Martiniozyma asiatica]